MFTESDLDRKTCPVCAAPVYTTYGLAGGGCGAYAMCTRDGCDWFYKEQDEQADHGG